jgi:hypothetical protein
MYTKEQVEQMLTGLFVFAGVSSNQGLKLIAGNTYDEQVKRVINSFDSLDKEKGEGMVTFVKRLMD